MLLFVTYSHVLYTTEVTFDRSLQHTLMEVDPLIKIKSRHVSHYYDGLHVLVRNEVFNERSKNGDGRKGR